MEVEVLSRGTINEQYLDDIAVAINAKLGSSSTMTPSEMASKITSIPTSSGAVLGHGSFSANGSYRASDDNLDGYSTVDVSIPMAILSASSNGTYTPSVGGYNQVNVNVPLSSITISANGSYSAAQGGYNDITVDVPQPTMSALSVSVNGSYTADPNTGFDTVVVDVPSAALSSKTITANGTYDAIDDSLDGYSSVVVSVPGSGVLGSKTISNNGVYNAVTDNLDGYSTVTVSVKGEYGQYDWYEDGIDVAVTVDDVNLWNSSSTTSFYDTYYNQHINTLTINAGVSTSISNLNANPFKKINFKKVVIGSGVTRVGEYGTNNLNCVKDLDIQSSNLNNINYEIGRSASSIVRVSFPIDASCNFNCSRMFADCKNLEIITLPSNLTSIPSSTFSGDVHLVSVNVDDLSNLTTIKEYAFQNCYALDMDFSKLTNLTTISRSAFQNVGIKKIKSNTLVSIGIDAFNGDINLNEVDASAVTNLSYSTFAGCTNLEKVSLSSSLSAIPSSCFQGCYSLKEIDLTNVNYIGSYAFNNCCKLQDINLNKIETIDGMAFDNAGLTQIVLPSTVTTLASSCFRSTKISMADLGSCTGIAVLPDSIFKDTNNLSIVVLPSTLSTLGSFCFQNCGLSEITIPSSITTISAYALYTNALKTLTLYDENISFTGGSQFSNYIENVYYRGSQEKTASDLETEYLAKYGSNDALKPTASRIIHYVPYEDWHTE